MSAFVAHKWVITVTCCRFMHYVFAVKWYWFISCILELFRLAKFWQTIMLSDSCVHALHIMRRSTCVSSFLASLLTNNFWTIDYLNNLKYNVLYKRFSKGKAVLGSWVAKRECFHAKYFKEFLNLNLII